MTIDEYKDLILEDEINIGYDVEEDDLPDQYDDCLLYTSDAAAKA